MTIVIELSRYLTHEEYDFFCQELNEFLYNTFDHWDVAVHFMHRAHGGAA